MEKNFIRVRSVWNIVISMILILIGFAFMILPDSIEVQMGGFFVLFIGLVLLWTMRTGYKDESSGEIFCKKERFFPHAKEEQLKEALTSPTRFNSAGENQGSGLRLDVYYNRKKVYLQLLEYVPHTYEPCSKFYEYDISSGAKFIRN